MLFGLSSVTLSSLGSSSFLLRIERIFAKRSFFDDSGAFGASSAFGLTSSVVTVVFTVVVVVLAGASFFLSSSFGLKFSGFVH